MRILVVIVNYFTEDLVYDQIYPFKDEDVLFVVVDNGSRRQEPLAEIDSFPNTSVVVPGENLGYLNGAFFGLKFASKEGVKPDWVIISNPDISFSRQFFERLRDLDSRNVAMVAPSIMSRCSGLDQNPFMVSRPSRNRISALKHLHYSPMLANMYRVFKYLWRMFPRPKTRVRESRYVYAPHGSCLVLSSSFLTRIDLVYPAFLFCEEIFLAEEARKLNLPVVYRPELSLEHSEHETTRFFRSGVLIQHHRNALEFCARTYWQTSR